MSSTVGVIKVFSATKARQRDALGEQVTAWIQANPGVQILRTIVAQSSDRKFHCLSIVLICSA
jgi:hypothetical protein